MIIVGDLYYHKKHNDVWVCLQEWIDPHYNAPCVSMLRLTKTERRDRSRIACRCSDFHKLFEKI